MGRRAALTHEQALLWPLHSEMGKEADRSRSLTPKTPKLQLFTQHMSPRPETESYQSESCVTRVVIALEQYLISHRQAVRL